MKTTNPLEELYPCDVCNRELPLCADPCGNVLCGECSGISFCLALTAEQVTNYQQHRELITSLQQSKPHLTVEMIHTLTDIGIDITS